MEWTAGHGTDEDPHDVLAAEAFAVPAPDPKMHEEPPHDVLAAEEFGVPAAPAPGAPLARGASASQRRRVAGALAGALVLAVLLLLRRRRS
jgi:hypothetical protein